MYIQNQMIIIFGATGKKMKRYILPALYGLYERGYLSQTMPIICIGDMKFKKNAFIDFLEPEKNIPNYNDKLVSGFFQLINYVRADIDKKDISAVCSLSERLNKKNSCGGNKLLYLASEPESYEALTETISKSTLTKGKGWKRIIYEKTPGKDLRFAKAFDRNMIRTFGEKNIFRIDHYLAKDFVENLIVERFSNRLIKTVWNKDNIDNIQITVSQKKRPDEESEGELYDMLSHILHIISLIAMDEPKSLNPDDINAGKTRIVKKAKLKKIHLGQYTAGKIDGEKVQGYKKENKNNKDTVKETFFAAKFTLDHKNWKNVPFYVRSGKRMSTDYSEVTIVLKPARCRLFNSRNVPSDNLIKIRIEPDQGISIRMNKKDHNKVAASEFMMDNCRNSTFKLGSYGAYEMLLHQALHGDHTLFAGQGFAETLWKLNDEIMIKKKNIKILSYPAGTMGPKDANLMLKKDKRNWIEY